MTQRGGDFLLALDPRETALVRFLWDIEENVLEMQEALSSLQTEGTNLELTEKLFYLAYRVREGALAAELNEVSQLARVLENIFEHARRGQVEMTSDLIAVLMPSCGALRRMATEGVGAEEMGGASVEAPESNAIGEAAVSIL